MKQIVPPNYLDMQELNNLILAMADKDLYTKGKGYQKALKKNRKHLKEIESILKNAKTLKDRFQEEYRIYQNQIREIEDNYTTDPNNMELIEDGSQKIFEAENHQEICKDAIFLAEDLIITSNEAMDQLYGYKVPTIVSSQRNLEDAKKALNAKAHSIDLKKEGEIRDTQNRTTARGPRRPIESPRLKEIQQNLQKKATLRSQGLDSTDDEYTMNS